MRTLSDWSLSILVGTAAIALFASVGQAAEKVERRSTSEKVSAWLADLPAAAAELEPYSPAREVIEAGELDKARAMLYFRPRAEAPLPEGFPSFTPVGVIEVKEYPAYRRAVGPSFWTLFQHIQKQQIPMTAPVEMNRAPGANGDGAMAFLYQNTGVGERGEIDGVEIEDVPATTVVSLGFRGGLNDRQVAESAQRLKDWLAGQSKYRAAKEPEMRVFGYNGPQVPERDRYGEVQILLKPAAP
ncbi:heme-binding protein [Botrimarina mediterranea]|uniref:heme-binding protein n=1 Tax=Botrimarina mediterranea TaxID=2528022 RepID=UPI00118D5407|nr:SOUL heme-binding protein [Planctomycetes bacterium K2D]